MNLERSDSGGRLIRLRSGYLLVFRQLSYQHSTKHLEGVVQISRFKASLFYYIRSSIADVYMSTT
jgi:hypothetical protein